jgi:4-amino-4-deoxy-L-arabinose transferase-like glycosyltransferase
MSAEGTPRTGSVESSAAHRRFSFLSELTPTQRYALAVVAASLILRVTWACFAHVTPVSDFDDYDRRAVILLNGGELDAYRTPGYPGFLVAVYFFFGHHLFAAQIAHAVLGAVTTGLIVMLATRIVSARAALVVGALHALWPTSLAYVGVLASENLAAPVIVGLVLALTTEHERLSQRARATALAGVLFGAAILVRPALLFFGPAVGLLALWETRAARWRIVPGLIFALAALASLAPWQIHNHRSGVGITTLSTTAGINLWMGNSDDAVTGGFRGGYGDPTLATFPTEEPERDRALKRAAVQWIISHFGRYLELSAIRTRRMWGLGVDPWPARYLWPTVENDRALLGFDEQVASIGAPSVNQTAFDMTARRKTVLSWFRVVFAPLILVGLFACIRRLRAFAGTLLPIASFTVLTILTFFDERFRETVDVLVMIPLGTLLSDLAFNTTELGWHRRILVGTCLVFVLVAVAAKLGILPI